jgi:glutamine synthetase
VDNRTSPFRIVGKGQNLRIEYRIPGGDVNQYICYSAMIASGINGIQQKTKPPTIQTGNSYDLKEIVRPPQDLLTAAGLFKKSELMQKLLGEDVHKHYSDFYHNEAMEFESHVTEWEFKRYFDII